VTTFGEMFGQVPPAHRLTALLHRPWWHGTSTRSKKAIRREGFKPPSPDLFVSDVGDLGTGIYLTNDPTYAQSYAHKAAGAIESGKPAVILVRAAVSNPLVLDFKNDKARATRRFDSMRARWGDTLRHIETYGAVRTKFRLRAARRWTRELAALGYDSVLASNYDVADTVTLLVFDPARLTVLQ